MARELLRAIDAKNEGQRRLIELCRTRKASDVARKMGIDPTAVRRHKSGKRTPDEDTRKAYEESWGIRASAWEEPLGEEPPTERA